MQKLNTRWIFFYHMSTLCWEKFDFCVYFCFLFLFLNYYSNQLFALRMQRKQNYVSRSKIQTIFITLISCCYAWYLITHKKLLWIIISNYFHLKLLSVKLTLLRSSIFSRSLPLDGPNNNNKKVTFKNNSKWVLRLVKQ